MRSLHRSAVAGIAFLLLISLSCSVKDSTRRNSERAGALVPVSLSNEFSSVTETPLPKHELPLSDFTLLHDDLIVLPLDGGIYAPGLGAWILDPGSFVFSVDFNPEELEILYVERTPNSCMVKGLTGYRSGSERTIANPLLKLKRGIYQVRWADTAVMFVYGKDDSGTWHIVKKENDVVADLYSTREPIRSLCPLNEETCLFFEGTVLKVLSLHGAVDTIKDFESLPDGVAVNAAGDIFLSFTTGIMRLRNDSQTMLTTGIHGPMLCVNRNLYVLWKEKDRIVKMSW